MTSPVNIPTPKKKRRSSLKRQRLVLLVTAISVLVLAVAFAVVYIITSRTLFEDHDGSKYYIKIKDGVYVLTDADGNLCPMTEDENYLTALGTILDIDAETGEFSVVAAVMTHGTETLEFTKYLGAFDILLYPMIERAQIQSIEVVNPTDSFAFVRNKDDDFDIRGNEDTPFDANMFSTLVVCTGYTSTYARIEAATVQQYGFAEYGLTDNPDDADTYFIITDTSGNSHKVVIGDEIPHGSGYYARYVGRDDVYVMRELEVTEYSTTFSNVIIKSKVEDFVTPTMVATMNTTNYFDVTNFKLNTVAKITDEMLDDPAFDPTSLLSNVITFSYSPIQKRQNTYYANTPYTGQGAYKSFEINDYKVDDCLQSLLYLEAIRTVKLYSEEENKNGEFLFAKDFGVAYCLEYTHNIERDSKNNYKPTDTIYQQLWISPLSESGTYYLYNSMFRMVVEVDRSQLEYLEWTPYAWIETDIFTGNIVYLDKVECTIAGGITVNGSTVNNLLIDVDNSASLVDWDPDNTENASVPTGQMKVWANGEPIEVLKFKRFFQTLIYSSLSGTASCSEMQQEIFRKAFAESGYALSKDAFYSKYGADFTEEEQAYWSQYGSALEDATPFFTITMTFTTNADGTGEKVVRTFCFYEYGTTGRQCFVSVNGQGSFYMLQNRANKIVDDLQRLFNDEEILPQGKN